MSDDPVTLTLTRRAAEDGLLLFEDLMDDSEANLAPASPGCVVCTSGATPDRHSAGLCLYHALRRALLGNPAADAITRELAEHENS